VDPGRGAEIARLVQDAGASLPLGPPEGREIVLHCRTAKVFDVVARLQELGARDVTVRAFDYLFRTENPLGERLFRRLD
jgi:ATP phosphoribosyltransferase